MRKYRTKLKIAPLLICLVAFVVLCGCETVKGMGRDIKKTDEWFREHAW